MAIGMKQFFVYFTVFFTIVLILSFFHAITYGLFLVIIFATIFLIRELFTVDMGRLKNGLVVLMTYISITILYSYVYYFLPEHNINPAFSRTLEGVFDAIYFSFVTIATLGYGDYVPTSFIAKALVISQLIIGLLIISFGINYILGKEKNNK